MKRKMEGFKIRKAKEADVSVILGFIRELAEYEKLLDQVVAKEKVSMIKDTYSFISPDLTPTSLIESFKKFYGPTMNAFEAAQKNGKADELYKQLIDLASSQNKSNDKGVSIPATFMRVTVNL